MTGRVSVAETSAYLKWAEGKLSEAEREHIVDILSDNPELGVVIKGSGGLRKVRIAMPGRGKRGGGRIVYWFYTRNFPVVLLFAFAKNEQSDLSAADLKVLKAVTDNLFKDFGGLQ